MVNSVNFTKRLVKVLDYYGLSATAFAEKIDFNRSTISHLLSGRNKPSLEFVLKLLDKFPEVELQWLLFGKGNFPTLPNEVKEKFSEKVDISSTDKKEVPDLFSEKLNQIENTPNTEEALKTISYSNNIDKIIFFYKDGSFKVYEN